MIMRSLGITVCATRVKALVGSPGIKCALTPYSASILWAAFRFKCGTPGLADSKGSTPTYRICVAPSGSVQRGKTFFMRSPEPIPISNTDAIGFSITWRNSARSVAGFEKIAPVETLDPTQLRHDSNSPVHARLKIRLIKIKRAAVGTGILHPCIVPVSKRQKQSLH